MVSSMQSLEIKKQSAETAGETGAREIGADSRHALRRPHRLPRSVTALALLSGVLACSAQVGPVGATHGSGGSGGSATGGSGGHSPGGTGAMPGSGGKDGNPGSGGSGGTAGPADPV